MSKHNDRAPTDHPHGLGLTTLFTAALRAEYEALWRTCAISDQHRDAVDALAVAVERRLARYAAVEAALGVPWFVVAAIHHLEASGDFTRHLHNGDSLTTRTVHVPSGRPPTGSPPFTWEASAADALRIRALPTWTDWSLAGVLYQLEGYNGFGYRNHHPEVRTPYLWSFSTHYTRGKYIADGQWSSSAVSEQCGAAVLLRRLAERGTIALGGLASVGPLLRFGTAGDAASELQEFLNTLGFALRVDGQAGPRTSAAVQAALGHYLVGDLRADD